MSADSPSGEPDLATEAGEGDEAPKAPTTGLGVDIVEIARMERILQRSPAFRTRNFSERERAYCDAHGRPAAHYATHFAAKEAVLKALGTGFSRGIKVTDVEVVHETSGRPLVVLHGRAKEIAAESGIKEIPLSLSRSQDTAVANAVALTSASRPATEEKKTARQELAERFMELRGMLDDMEGRLPAEDAADDEAEGGEGR